MWVVVTVEVGLCLTASQTVKGSVYDSEFLVVTSVKIELKEGVELTDEQVRRRVTGRTGEQGTAVQWLAQAADDLAQADVSAGDSLGQFQVTSATLTADQMAALMQTKSRGQTNALVDRLERDGVIRQGNTCRFETKPIAVTATDDEADAGERTTDQYMTLEEFAAARDAAVDYARRASDNLSGARIQTVHDIDEEGSAAATAFEIITVESNKQLVKEAIVVALGDELAIERPISFVHHTDADHPEGFYPIEEDDRYLSDVIGGEANYDVRRYKGGLALVFDQLDPPQTVEAIKTRIKELRLQPDFASDRSRDYDVFGLTAVGGAISQEPTYNKVAMVVVDEELPFYEVRTLEDRDHWMQTVAQPELDQVTEALRSEKTLRKVIQFAPQVAAQSRNQAMLAVAVALAAIVAYVWIRFGTMQFGLAAIVALVHDVAITLGFITLSDYFHGGVIGEFLMIEDFKIDLPMIAAMLTIIGYSLNDTIVVFDRIRENRGKMTTLSPQMINTSINQTLSRTLLTSVTTFLVVAIMYFLGGPGVHGFAYALMMGVVVGTYSSIGIATPLLYRPRLLHIIVYLLIALGAVGVASVATSGTLLLVIGAVVAVVLAWAIYLETRPERDYSRLVTATA